jgi:hypothetical protein
MTSLPIPARPRIGGVGRWLSHELCQNERVAGGLLSTVILN